MNWQDAFNGLLGVMVTVVGFLMKNLHSDVKELENKLDQLPDIYARRDDVKDGFTEMRSTLLRIENKIDMKADRHA